MNSSESVLAELAEYALDFIPTLRMVNMEKKFARLTNDLTIANVFSANNCWSTDINLKKAGKNRHQLCSGRPMEELG